MNDEIAAQRGKRGVLTIKIGGTLRTMTIPIEQTKAPLEALKRRKRKS